MVDQRLFSSEINFANPNHDYAKTTRWTYSKIVRSFIPKNSFLFNLCNLIFKIRLFQHFMTSITLHGKFSCVRSNLPRNIIDDRIFIYIFVMRRRNKFVIFIGLSFHENLYQPALDKKKCKFLIKRFRPYTQFFTYM